MRRIQIFGASDSGVTTLGFALAERLDCPYFDSDEYLWLPTDISLARRDIYTFLATSHYESKQDFIAALNRLIENPAYNGNAFDEQKYAEAYAKNVKELIAEYQ